MIRLRSLLLSFLFVVGALGLGAYWWFANPESKGLQTSVSVADALAGDTSGYRRATTVRNFAFPDDHGPHPGFKNEWWYVTGNLEGPEGASYGYELTIFRIALTPPSEATPGGTSSDWRTNQLYMAHFAVTNGANETFHAFEQFSRGDAGLAGAQADPFRVWVENWTMRSVGQKTFPIRLHAQANELGIDLTLFPEKARVLQGKQGLSKKGPGSGNASYYYSYPRLETQGRLHLQGDTVAVSGTSWMDREWSTSALGPTQEGWDWFALHLADGRDLMYYQLRNRDGSPSRFSEGILIGPDGSTQPIAPADVSIDVLDTWTSPDESHTYPVEWQIRIPSQTLDLHVQSLIPNQELDVSVRYWEGAVRVDGSVSGRGYVEMTGYGDSPGSPAS